MAFIHLTRRELIAAAPLVLAAPSLVRAAPPDPTVWRFLVVGDWGRGGSRDQWETAQAMALVAEQKQTEFVVSTGDNIYRWGLWSKTDPRWETSFSRVYAEKLGPWYSVLGNHDYGGSVDAQIWHGTRPDKRFIMDCRWFDRRLENAGRPSLHLFFFDTVAWRGKEDFPFQLWGSKMDAATKAEQERDMLPRLNSDAPIKIAFGHHGIFSIGKHGGAPGLEGLDQHLRDAGVKAWVNGHDHCLYHVEHRIKQRTMHYVCSGAGSEVLDAYTGGPQHCVLTSPCDGIGEDAAAQPVWRSFYRKAPDTPMHIKGGFALFELGAASGRFQFYDSNAHPLGDGPVSLY